MKQPVVFFLFDVMGGVASVVTNIVVHAASGERKISMVAYRDRHDARKAMIFPEAVKDVCQHFYYDNKSNFFYTARRLRKIITTAQPVIVATDLLELEMIQSTALDEKTVFILLGDFDHYYDIAQKYAGIINGFIAISNEIFIKLKALMPDRKGDIHLAYFPTPAVKNFKSSPSKNGLRIIFAARLDAGKNPLLLLSINSILKQRGISVQWTIVGDGPLGDSFKQQAQNLPEFVFTGTVSNHDLHELYLQHDIFIMTSEMEGLPVSLIEAMKTGLVPVVSDIPGGIREVVTNQVNGFLCGKNHAVAFASGIAELANSPYQYERFSLAAIKTANEQFDPVTNSNHYLDIIDNISFVKGNKPFTKKAGNRLDRPWIPGLLVKWIRNLRTG